MLQNHTGGLWLDVHDADGTVELLPLIGKDRLAGRWHDVSLQVRWSRKGRWIYPRVCRRPADGKL